MILMNKIYNKELYYFSLITFLINPLDFISNNDGIIINFNNSHKLVIRGNIINSLENEFYIPKNIIDIVIIPALACDKNGYRLGYGGGFYDRFLKHFNGFKLCCVPNCFLLDSVSPENYDIKVDLIITD